MEMDITVVPKRIVYTTIMTIRSQMNHTSRMEEQNLCPVNFQRWKQKMNKNTTLKRFLIATVKMEDYLFLAWKNC